MQEPGSDTATAADRKSEPPITDHAPPISFGKPLASFRLPPFSAEEPELWLIQMEFALEVSGIDDDRSRMKLLAANLPIQVAAQVKDIILCPTASFVDLCSALRSRLATLRASRLEALLQHQQLGYQRPSQLLRNMRNELTAAGDPGDTGLLRTLFLQRLPQSARAALSLLPEDSPLDGLAEAADRYVSATAT